VLPSRLRIYYTITKKKSSSLVKINTKMFQSSSAPKETGCMKSPVQMENPVGTALVFPRRKAGQAKLGRGTQAVLLTKSDLEKLMHLRLGEASKQLGLGATTVKKVCRMLGILQWSNAPSREHCDDGRSDENHGSSLESVSSRKSFLDNTQAVAWPAHSLNNEHESCMASGSAVASDTGPGIIFTASTATAQERADSPTSTSTSSSSTVDGGRSADPSEALNPAP
jgi:hypothetical protein